MRSSTELMNTFPVCPFVLHVLSIPSSYQDSHNVWTAFRIRSTALGRRRYDVGQIGQLRAVSKATGRPLWTRQWTYGFHKTWKMSSLAEWLLVSQGLWSMQLGS
jgi:hypothetical protein